MRRRLFVVNLVWVENLISYEIERFGFGLPILAPASPPLERFCGYVTEAFVSGIFTCEQFCAQRKAGRRKELGY
jgi:hypothetical protein